MRSADFHVGPNVLGDCHVRRVRHLDGIPCGRRPPSCFVLAGRQFMSGDQLMGLIIVLPLVAALGS